MNKVQYAFGRDYLESWTIEDALREVFQNYIDYGKYDLKVKDTPNPNIVNVTISNDYNPNSLEFLRLGNTSKSDGKSIGHHGEGLKAAFLIFTRENHYFALDTYHYRLIGGFDRSVAIGESFHITYTSVDFNDKLFKTTFNCPREIYNTFVSNIITKDDILFDDDYYGQLINNNKSTGNIYSGNLFVCNIPNLNYSYNINPEHLSLDRDRRVPYDWDIDRSTSKILEAYNRSKVVVRKPVNYNSRDYSYVSRLTDEEVKPIKAITVDNKIQFYDTYHKEVINNQRVKDVLKNHPKFKKDNVTNRKDKFTSARIAAKNKKVITLLNTFKKNYCRDNESADIDIDVIIYKLKKETNNERTSK